VVRLVPVDECIADRIEIGRQLGASPSTPAPATAVASESVITLGPAVGGGLSMLVLAGVPVQPISTGSIERGSRSGPGTPRRPPDTASLARTRSRTRAAPRTLTGIRFRSPAAACGPVSDGSRLTTCIAPPRYADASAGWSAAGCATGSRHASTAPRQSAASPSSASEATTASASSRSGSLATKVVHACERSASSASRAGPPTRRSAASTSASATTRAGLGSGRRGRSSVSETSEATSVVVPESSPDADRRSTSAAFTASALTSYSAARSKRSANVVVIQRVSAATGIGFAAGGPLE